MTEHPRWFPSGSTRGGGWGQSHLALDAVVAFVDEELSPGPRRRALSHLAGCGECAAEVVAQTQARLALRAAGAPALPSSLMSSLRDIPSHADLPSAPAGLAVGPDGEIVTVLRPAAPRRRAPDRRVRLGAGAVVSGLALGALFATGGAELVPAAAPTVQGPASGATVPRSAVGASMQLGNAPTGSGVTRPTVPVAEPVVAAEPAVAARPGTVPVAEPAVAARPDTLPVGPGAGSVPEVAVVPAISLPRR